MNKERKKENNRRYYQRHKEKIKEYNKQYRQENKEEIKERDKEYRQKHREKLNKQDKQYHQTHKEEAKQYAKRYGQDHKEELKQYRQENKEEAKEYMKQYRQENKEKIKEQCKRYGQDPKNKERINKHRKIRWQTDLRFNLSRRISNMIYASLHNGSGKQGRHWETLVGYTTAQLKRHLKKTMPNGYSWQDYLEGKFHIDHIFPIAVFNFTSPEDIDFQRCWALDNLQLLPAKENLRKYAKLIKPFQGYLPIKVKIV